ncbi:uncharacterized protein K489DRAFT_383175 [Dissoconium aciculare CBS 342.82]|uniref:Uncharacterized protein n=1 Tax=Dissoconium aciculare CBS 342.82 TaxID=1314786 RepID=A0A6J3LXH6_9PEZI|nr:uncharacterized protein K489DRAFT_383175 [Dissoconium aciculare CBS 342.82]KAF1820373.1 hypothetical protein K489DRAFT_383175 [Dissoconium aciculare CBS 342.82]
MHSNPFMRSRPKPLTVICQSLMLSLHPAVYSDCEMAMMNKGKCASMCRWYSSRRQRPPSLVADCRSVGWHVMDSAMSVPFSQSLLSPVVFSNSCYVSTI